MPPCANCLSGMAEHYHCDRCGCTSDGECDYGGWHDEPGQHRPGCYDGCPNTTCTGVG